MLALVRQPDGTLMRKGPQIDVAHPRVAELIAEDIKKEYRKNIDAGAWTKDTPAGFPDRAGDGLGYSVSPESLAIGSGRMEPDRRPRPHRRRDLSRQPRHRRRSPRVSQCDGEFLQLLGTRELSRALQAQSGRVAIFARSISRASTACWTKNRSRRRSIAGSSSSGRTCRASRATSSPTAATTGTSRRTCCLHEGADLGRGAAVLQETGDHRAQRRGDQAVVGARPQRLRLHEARWDTEPRLEGAAARLTARRPSATPQRRWSTTCTA
jgi:hypothetical protein